MDEIRFGSRQRSRIVFSIIVLLVGMLCYRLYQLQFVEFEQFRSQAEKNSIRRISREPLRGLIYDRDSNLIVDDNPSYTLAITPFEFRWQNMPLLCRLFNRDSSVIIDSNLVRERLEQVGKNSFDPVKVARDLSFPMLALLEENKSLLPGVNVVIETRRQFKMLSRMSHLIGYTKEISPALLKKLGSYYQPGDVVGFNGIESYYEDILRGHKGYGFYTVDSRGKVVESFEHGQSDISAAEGTDLVLSIDDRLQEFVEETMKHRRGALVAMDPNNGEILAFASSPDYNLEEMTGKVSIDIWRKLNADPGFPLYNRCSMAAYPPGSTFKMMLAAAALQEGIIDESSTISCPGSFTLAGVTFKCHGAHGNVNVVHAIEYSCNVFFYKLIFKLGFEAWSRYGDLFHFGKKTGMDIANENPGVLPSEAYYNKRYGKRWNKGFLVSLGIGQGEVNATPLQMAAYVSTIANGGRYYRPHVVRELIDHAAGTRNKIPPAYEKLPISDKVWAIVQNGMYRVVNGNGTGYAARIGGATVAGKTGTAQNPHGQPHAWFVGYAPYKTPKIAVAVIVENGGYGGDAAAPLAASVIRRYLFGNVQPAAVSDTLPRVHPQVRDEDVETHPSDLQD